MIKVTFDHVHVIISVLTCFFMASFYVLSLYLWSGQNRYNRNASHVIKRRFLSVFITCVVSLGLVYFLCDPSVDSKSTYLPFNEWIGFKDDSWSHLIVCVRSLILTMILFSGPLMQYSVKTIIFHYQYKEMLNENNRIKAERLRVLNNSTTLNDSDNNNNTIETTKTDTTGFIRSLLVSNFYWARYSLTDICFWRNYVVSPFTEEFVFRSCMLPLLVPHLQTTASIFLSPLFFGLAHLHHIYEGYKMQDGASLAHLCAQHMFQFAYTYVFGVFSSFLFMRTGSLFASFVSHSFCNAMGFPNIGELLGSEFKGSVKMFLVAWYVAGLILFVYSMFDMTDFHV